MYNFIEVIFAYTLGYFSHKNIYSSILDISSGDIFCMCNVKIIFQTTLNIITEVYFQGIIILGIIFATFESGSLLHGQP